MSNTTQKKVGRPELSPIEKRNQPLSIRVNKSEQDTIIAFAQRRGVSVTQAIIDAVNLANEVEETGGVNDRLRRLEFQIDKLTKAMW